MKKRLIGPVIGAAIIVIAVVIIFGFTEEITEEVNGNEKEDVFSPSENSVIRDREWVSSGPFSLDRSEYLLGENIFIQIDGLKANEEGQIAFLRPLNETHYSVYTTVPFDGSKKSEFNSYFKPGLSALREICSSKDLVGNWTAVFQGTSYESIRFKIVNETLPGDEYMHSPIC